MDEHSLAAKLAEITGFLEPTADASAADLRAARSALAYALLRGQAEATHAPAPPGATPELLSDSALHAELEQILTEAAREAETKSGELLETRVFRRELPLLTSQHPASVPAWAAGLQIDSTLGPFRGFGGRLFWFDLYRIARQVTVVRLPGMVPMFSLPIRGPLRAATGYRLGPGSVWLAAPLLTTSVPSGSYTGLRIRGGTLRLSAPATVVVGVIQLPDTVTVTLTLELDAPIAAPGTGFGPGADAANSAANLPLEATFVFAPSRHGQVTASDASMRLYGVTVPLRRTPANPIYEPALNRILVPYTTSLASFTVAESHSTLFTLSGTAPIAGGAWALPVAVISPAALGRASGAGALVVQTQPGLRATWPGLAGGTMTLDAAFLMVEPGRLAVTSLHSQNRRATQTLALWVEGGTPRRSSIDLQYIQPFPLRYFSMQSGVEALLLAGKAVAHLDRPLRADGTRLGIVLPEAALVLVENATGVSVDLIGTLPPPSVPNSAPEKPLALALANALFKTTPPRMLTLFGTLDGAASPAVQNGDLHLSFELYLTLPTLPDPYAANFDVPLEGSHDTMARLDCRVQWTVADPPVLSFAFLPLEANRPPRSCAGCRRARRRPGAKGANIGRHSPGRAAAVSCHRPAAARPARYHSGR